MRTALRNARKRKGLSVACMADTLGITRSSYYKFEQGVRTPAIKTAIKIAEILDSTVEHLFSDKDERLQAS